MSAFSLGRKLVAGMPADVFLLYGFSTSRGLLQYLYGSIVVLVWKYWSVRPEVLRL